MPIDDWTRVDAGACHDFHSTWIPQIRHTLRNGVLPRGYYAMVEQAAAGVTPDALALKRDEPAANGNHGAGPSKGSEGIIGLAAASPKVQFRIEADPTQYATKAKRVAIRHRSGDDLVAVIEIVSPGNKHSRSAFRSFVSKAVDLVQAGVHVMVIDLLPPTPRDPHGIHAAIWEELAGEEFTPPADKPLTLASYLAGERKVAFVEPTAVGQTLIEMPLFLEDAGYVNLPLEVSYMAAFADLPEHLQRVLTG